jgi:putative aldouronate transport system substrate-binding protein
MEGFMLRKRVKFLMVLFLSLLMTMSLWAGGGGQEAAGPSAQAPAQTGPFKYPVQGSPKITIARTADTDIPTAGYSSYNETPGVKAWIKQTGVNVEFIEPADATAFLLYLAGGNPPDLIMSGKNFYPGGIPKLHDDGLAIDLTNYLPTYAPNYWKLINSRKEYLNAIREIDGKHYTYAGRLVREDNETRSWAGLVIRKEHLDKLNIQMPETPTELYNYLKRLKNELNIEIPFMSDKARFNYLFDHGTISSGFGLPKSTIYQENGKIHHGSYEQSYKAYLTFLHQLYTEKLLDNNFAVTDEPTAHAAILSGRSGVLMTATSRIGNLTTAAKSDDFTLMGIPSLTTAKGVKPLHSLKDPLVTDSYWTFFTEKCKQVENALRFLDYVYTEEGNILANFGEEGVTFNYVNGQPVFNDYMNKNPKGLPLVGLLRVHGFMNFPMIQDNRMSLQRFALPQQLQAMAVWSNSNADSYAIGNNSVLSQYADEFAIISTDISTYIGEARAQFISGELGLDKFDSVYIAGLKRMGMDKLLDIYQKSYDAYNK